MKTEPQTDHPEPASPAKIGVKKAEGGDLDNIFKDDDDADFLASEVGAVSIVPGSGPSDPLVMLAFYQRLFPFRPFFQWLNHSPVPCHDFGHREFAFTLQNSAYLRYQSFPTMELLRKEIVRLNPSRFEIGPVYNANPRDRKTLLKSAFHPLSKELVFDIDLTDYDEIRTCCDQANICNLCWNFITVAIKVMNAELRDDLGFKHVLWVYSGRRGAHAWVCDKRARSLDDAKRRAVANYLEVVRGGGQAGKKVIIRRPLHPHVSRSLNLLKDRFENDILRDQDPWRDNEKAEKLLQLLPDKILNDALRKKWDNLPNRPSISKWADIYDVAETGISKELNPARLKESKEEVVLEYMYPRLDAEVSKHLNHLLKSPFCVHPQTGRVCVPIDERDLEAFDPMAVPTVVGLLGEIDAWDRVHKREGKTDGIFLFFFFHYQKTSLKPYVDYFKTFVNGLLQDEAAVKREREGNSENSIEF
ncbi:prim-pol domain-containing protein [Tuber magnatum]|uniref:DNA primase n=1 Tax=Tuber magnatum TaxID=42249 RepID=A0A317T013_9PEZI|nr:prim-pol domain-containing protein [Tuber magnatum]